MPGRGFESLSRQKEIKGTSKEYYWFFKGRGMRLFFWVSTDFCHKESFFSINKMVAVFREVYFGSPRYGKKEKY